MLFFNYQTKIPMSVDCDDIDCYLKEMNWQMHQYQQYTERCDIDDYLEEIWREVRKYQTQVQIQVQGQSQYQYQAQTEQPQVSCRGVYLVTKTGPVCKFFERGVCRFGNNCRNYHPPFFIKQ